MATQVVDAAQGFRDAERKQVSMLAAAEKKRSES